MSDLELIDEFQIAQATNLLFNDNQGSIAWASSEAITKRLRHLNIREVAVRDAQRLGEVSVGHIPGTLNVADIFTKEMKDTAHFVALRASIMSRRLDGVRVMGGVKP